MKLEENKDVKVDKLILKSNITTGETIIIKIMNLINRINKCK